MKWLAMALLLANFAFLGWNYLQEQDSIEVSSPVSPLKGKRLELVSERSQPPTLERSVDKLKQAAAQPPSGSSAPRTVAKQVQPEPRCYRVHGLADAASARRVATQLESLGAQLVSEGTEAGTETKFWVFLPPFRSNAAALPAISQLKRRGFSDYYLVKSGQNANAVSLGVFSDRAGAERRLARIRRYGLAPSLDEIAFPVQRRWALFRWESREPFPAKKVNVPSSAVEQAQCGG